MHSKEDTDKEKLKTFYRKKTGTEEREPTLGIHRISSIANIDEAMKKFMQKRKEI